MELEHALGLLRARAESVRRPTRLPTETEVARVEIDLQFPFPAQYRQFQLTTSDVVYGVLEPGLVLPDVPKYQDLRHTASGGWDAGIGRDHLPFCQSDGDYFTIGLDGRIGRFYHDEESHAVWEADFAFWIAEYWLEDYDL